MRSKSGDRTTFGVGLLNWLAVHSTWAGVYWDLINAIITKNARRVITVAAGNAGARSGLPPLRRVVGNPSQLRNALGALCRVSFVLGMAPFAIRYVSAVPPKRTSLSMNPRGRERT
jgi:hypothetical protein